MTYASPLPAELLRQFKGAGKGLAPRPAGELIIRAVLDYFHAEITVLDRNSNGELFRVGPANAKESHKIIGVHIHPVQLHSETWELMAHRRAVSFVKDVDFNMYLGLFLQALELGNYRVGLK